MVKYIREYIRRMLVSRMLEKDSSRKDVLNYWHWHSKVLSEYIRRMLIRRILVRKMLFRGLGYL